MRYINPNSKSGIVNKFADYIVKEIDQNLNSIIEVIYLGNFFIIKGVTEHDKVLDLHELRNSFVDKYHYLLSLHGIDTINFIDVIQYNHKFNETDIDFKFHNSDLIRYHQEVIDYVLGDNLNPNVESIEFDGKIKTNLSDDSFIDKNCLFEFSPLSVKSEFPYGHSLKSNRLKLFYSEYIINQIIHLIDTNEITFRFSNDKNNEDDLNIRVFSWSMYSEVKIKSLILDVFDFNLNKFKNDFVNQIDLEYEIENQLVSPKWFVRDRFKDLILF